MATQEVLRVYGEGEETAFRSMIDLRAQEPSTYDGMLQQQCPCGSRPLVPADVDDYDLSWPIAALGENTVDLTCRVTNFPRVHERSTPYAKWVTTWVHRQWVGQCESCDVVHYTLDNWRAVRSGVIRV